MILFCFLLTTIQTFLLRLDLPSIQSDQAIGYNYRSFEVDQIIEYLQYVHVTNIPSKSLRIQMCYSDHKDLTSKLIGQQFTLFLEANGFIYRNKHDINCIGYNFWYASFKNYTDIIEKVNKHLIDLTFSNIPSSYKQPLRIRQLDQYDLILYPVEDHRIQFCIDVAALAYSRNIADIKYLPKQYFRVKDNNMLKHYRYIQQTLIQVQQLEPEPTFLFSRYLKGTGFHQTLEYYLTIPGDIDIHSQCTLDIQQQLSASMYIDVDQFGQVKYYELINIEKPSFLSKQIYYKLTFKINQLYQQKNYKLKLKYPIHFRYHAASLNSFQRIPINYIKSMKVKCQDTIYTFKDQSTQQSAKIPVGDASTKQKVNFLTTVVALSCALFIGRSLKSRPIQQ